VDLLVCFKVGSRHVLDVAVVHVAGRQFAGRHEVAQPLGHERLVVGVEGEATAAAHVASPCVSVASTVTFTPGGLLPVA